MSESELDKLIAETEQKKIAKEQDDLNGCGVGCAVVALVFFALLIFGQILSMINPKFSSSSSSSNTSSREELVENSAWDGSVYQVVEWLKNNLKDPDSLEFIEWSPVEKTVTGDFRVRVKYRAKNSFGGYMVENKIFVLDSSGSVSHNELLQD